MTLSSPSPTASETSNTPNWREHQPPADTYPFELVLEIAAVIFAVIIGRALFPDDGGYWMNVYMTGIGVLITVLVLDRRAERRDRLREERELKAQLVRDAKSGVNDVAKNAIHQLRERDWLTGKNGLLAKADLRYANLQGANLAGANLEEADLIGANLQHINLHGANLRKANLSSANLRKANLLRANLQEADLGLTDLQDAGLNLANLQRAELLWTNLQGAKLVSVNLQEAILFGANLRSATLSYANLENASLGEGEDTAKLDETTRLPDFAFWSTDTDMTKFTHPCKDADADQTS